MLRILRPLLHFIRYVLGFDPALFSALSGTKLGDWDFIVRVLDA